MEGYLRFKIRPVPRRLVTRLLAVGPAALAIGMSGDAATYTLLIASQVVLSLQLPFAVIPLIHFTSDRSLMGEFTNKYYIKITAWVVATIIVSFNVKLVLDQVIDSVRESANPFWIYSVVIPMFASLFILLLYITIKPLVHLPPKESIPAWKKLGKLIRAEEDQLELAPPHYKKVGVALALTDQDIKVLSHALPLAKQHNADLFCSTL